MTYDVITVTLTPTEVLDGTEDQLDTDSMVMWLMDKIIDLGWSPVVTTGWEKDNE